MQCDVLSQALLHLYIHGKLSFEPVNLSQELCKVGGAQNLQQTEK